LGLGNGWRIFGRSVAEITGLLWHCAAQLVAGINQHDPYLWLAAGTDDARTCHFLIRLFLRDAFQAPSENQIIRKLLLLLLLPLKKKTLRIKFQRLSLVHFLSPTPRYYAICCCSLLHFPLRLSRQVLPLRSSPAVPSRRGFASRHPHPNV
jgi:hypothetical protein